MRVVPYITLWSGEPHRPRVMTWHTIRGLGYADERPGDRIDGVLWSAHHEAPGRGNPVWVGVHPQRQRACMTNLLCQVCGQKPPPDERGPLFLMPEDRTAWHGWPEGAITTQPPVCPRCAQLARAHCPSVGGRPYLAIRSAASDVAGVHGSVYVPDESGAVMLPHKHLVQYGQPHARWVVAGQLTRSLHQCVQVDLDAEITAGTALSSR